MKLFFETMTVKYLDFRGRASRTEYWVWTLINSIVGAVTLYLLLQIAFVPPQLLPVWVSFVVLGLILYLLVTFIPTIAVSVRRLHDIGFSGWWVLVALCPPLSVMALHILALFPSDRGENKYGAQPSTSTHGQPIITV